MIIALVATAIVLSIVLFTFELHRLGIVIGAKLLLDALAVAVLAVSSTEKSEMYFSVSLICASTLIVYLILGWLPNLEDQKSE